MRIRLILAAALAAALAFTATGQAQKPPKSGAVTLKASAAQVTFSKPVTLTGKVKGAKAGVLVTLERRAAAATPFVPAGTATTDGNGDYSFTQQPAESSVFRATAATTPPASSADTPVAVAPLVGLKVSDATPRKGQRVRFRGTVRPQHDGTRVAIQRKRADGTWVTVRSPLLHLPDRHRRPRGPRGGRQPRAHPHRPLSEPGGAARWRGTARAWEDGS